MTNANSYKPAGAVYKRWSRNLKGTVFPSPTYGVIDMAFKNCVLLAACAVICAAQPVQKLSVLKDQPAEVLYKESRPGVLECVLEGGQNAKYTWLKDGKPFTPTSETVQRKDEGTLEFRTPKPSDEGEYQCFAETEHGVANSRVIRYKRAYIVAPSVKTQTHKAVEGRPFKLDCSAPDAYPIPTISWKTQQDGSNTLEPYLNRRITPSPDGTLWFSNVTKEDADPKMKYICVASSPAFEEDVKLAEHYIKDLEADSKPNNGDLVPQYLSNDIVAKTGTATGIWCIYGGTPLAHPDWFKNGKDVNGKPSDRITRHNRTSGRRLLIKETLLEDQGTYKCVANNEVGKPQEHTIQLKVVSDPSFAKKPEKQTSAKSGQDVTIPCQAIGVPAPDVTYTFNGKPLATSERVSTNPEGISIKNVQASDKGYYGCRAQSEFGDEYVESLVTVA